MNVLCVTLLTLNVFMETTSEHFKVVGSTGPLVVDAGSDLVLPCSLQPNISAVDMTVEWSRLYESDSLVHLYQKYEDKTAEQIESYRGRTALFKEELQRGNTSLKLSAVQPSDEGQYKCSIQFGSYYDDITLYIRVLVKFKVVGSAGPLVVDAGSDLVLPCSLQPNISAVDMMVEWSRLYESDSLVHLYEKYEDRTAEQIESYRGRTALFKVELQRGNTSLKLSAVQPSDEGQYKCFIQFGSYYDDISVYVEVKGKGFHAGKIAIISFTVFGVLLFAFTVCILKDKFSDAQLSPAQCSAITYMHLKSVYVRNKFDLRQYDTSEEGYRRLIPAISNCRKALCSGCNLTEQSCEALCAALQSENSSLKQLDLRNNHLQDSGVEKLSAGLKSLHCKVEVLTLAECKLGQQSCASLQSILELPNWPLRDLDLSNNDLKDSGVKLLSDGLKSSHCKLVTLRLSNCNLGGKACENLGLVLQSENCPLRELDLSNNELQDSGVKLLSDGLRSSHCKLKTLRLAFCKLKAESWLFLTSALQPENSPLRELDLSNNDLHAVELLPDGLKSLQLEILRLAICNLGPNACESLGSVLQSANCPLRELDLSNNDLKDSGAKLLSDGVKSSQCKLVTLSLSGCMITEEGCSSLASALTLNPSHLKELDLTYNHPGDLGVKLLSARLKDQHCRMETLRLEDAGSIRLKGGLRKYFCHLTLDQNTANRVLILSAEKRVVTDSGTVQPYSDHPERFDDWYQVLCEESVCGRCYWEVEWSSELWVSISVSYRGIRRKGRGTECLFGRNNQSWSLCCSSTLTFCHNNIETEILESPSSRIGVYVDHSAGTLSFYRVSDTMTLLHSVHTTFTQPLYAGFGLYGPGSTVRLCDPN